VFTYLVTRSHRAAWAALLLVTAGVACGREESAFPGPFNWAEIYAAALGSTGTERPARAQALMRELMSDSGTYEVSGRLPDSVVASLLARGLASEVCAAGGAEHGVPTCRARVADTDLQFSRPIPLGRDTVRVFVGGGSIRPQNDTSSLPRIPFGVTLDCRVVSREGRWQRDRCDTWTIT
jgi:hypothetical protein